MGYPKSKRCPECQAKVDRERKKERRKNGPARKLGSEDFCKNCGKPYIVKSGLQKYCPECAEAAIRQVVNEHKHEWYKEHYDPVKRRESKKQRVCVVCGKTFSSPLPTVTCSPECAKEQLRIYRATAAIKRGRANPSRLLASQAAPQSGVPGITWQEGKWLLTINGKKIGVYPTVEEAKAEKSKREIRKGKRLPKTVCTYPQYQCCGKKDCPLFTTCSQNPLTVPEESVRSYLKKGVQPGKAEKWKHNAQSVYYNIFFGDYLKRQNEYTKEWNKKNYFRGERKRKQKKPTKAQQAMCPYECEHCPYDMCNIPAPKNKSEYDKLYHTAFSERLKAKRKEYREANQTVLRNKTKINHYKLKGIHLNPCILLQTNNPQYKCLEGIKGDLMILYPTGTWFAFVSADRQYSFRYKIAEQHSEEPDRPAAVWYLDPSGHEYTFRLLESNKPIP